MIGYLFATLLLGAANQTGSATTHIRVLGEAFQLGDETLSIGTPKEAVDAFSKLCLHPFPTEAAFKAKVEVEPSFTAVDAAQSGTLLKDRTVGAAVGGMWVSRTLALRYISMGAVAAAVPQPQCSVTVRVANAPDAPSIAAMAGSALALGPATTIGAAPRLRHLWTVTQADGSAWRVLLKTERNDFGGYVKLSVLRLASVSP